MKSLSAFAVLSIVLLGFVVISFAETSGAMPPGLVYEGRRTTLTFQQLAAYCAPTIWFSPDEPLLTYQDDGTFELPLPLPFEESTGRAVVYFRVTKVIGVEDALASDFWTPASRKENFVLHLDKIANITLHFFFYYDRETGVGAHAHDFETTEFSLDVSSVGYDTRIQVREVIGHAHGVQWYFNTLDVYEAGDVVFPVTILVEEGKHGNCTDRNGDGFYTPGYDVNRRVNDAWGVKDVMGAGVMLTPTYNSWMTKIRFPESRIAPPLPEDSPWYGRFTSPHFFGNANKRQYELRPVPNIEDVDFSQIEKGANLKHFIESKGYSDWPEAIEDDAFGSIGRELFDESFLSSYGWGVRYDEKLSVTLTFPLLLVRNFEAPYVGGWFVQRIYANLGVFSGDFKLWGHQFTYTPSASRWTDWYAGIGYEIRDRGMDNNVTDYVYEAGNKFRINITQTPFGFLKYLGSEFWGLRLGVRANGFPEINNLGFIVELGAGVW